MDESNRITARHVLEVLPLFGLLIAGLLLAFVMMDAAGYRACDQWADPECVSVTGDNGGRFNPDAKLDVSQVIAR